MPPYEGCLLMVEGTVASLRGVPANGRGNGCLPHLHEDLLFKEGGCMSLDEFIRGNVDGREKEVSERSNLGRGGGGGEGREHPLKYSGKLKSLTTVYW